MVRAAAQENDGREHTAVAFIYLKEKHIFLVISHQPDLQLIKYIGHICCQLNTCVERWGSVESVWLSPARKICGNMLSLGCAEEMHSGTYATLENCEDKHLGGKLS